MRTRFCILALLIALPAGLYAAGMFQSASPQAGTAAKPAATSAHFATTASDLHWTPMFLGLERVVVSGDPDKPGAPFVMRLRSKAAATIAAHYHPVDENVTVLAGTLKLGMGEKYDAKALHPLTAGSYSFMPKNTRHFGTFLPGTVIQVHGVGPFQLIFVNPADDPRTAAPKK